MRIFAALDIFSNCSSTIYNKQAEVKQLKQLKQIIWRAQRIFFLFSDFPLLNCHTILKCSTRERIQETKEIVNTSTNAIIGKITFLISYLINAIYKTLLLAAK